MKFMEFFVFITFFFSFVGISYFSTPLFLYLLKAKEINTGEKDQLFKRCLRSSSLLLNVKLPDLYVTKYYENQFFILDSSSSSALIIGVDLYQSLNENEISDLALIATEMIKKKIVRKNNFASLVFLPIHIMNHLSKKMGQSLYYLVAFITYPFLIFQFKLLAQKKKLLIVKRKHFENGYQLKNFNALIYKMEQCKSNAQFLSLNYLEIIPKLEGSIFQTIYSHQEMDVYCDKK